MEQGSPEWFAARLGKVTASRVADIIASTKSGYSASRKNYMTELICERLTGLKTESYTNAAMQRGTELEPIARSVYEMKYGVIVREVGLIDHPTIPMCGASPDGLTGDIGIIEIKCPNPATHVESLLTNEFNHRYFTQMQWQLACTKRTWCDFVSFCPEIDDDLQLFVKQIPRDDNYIAYLEEEVIKFLNELDEKLNLLKGLKNGISE